MIISVRRITESGRDMHMTDLRVEPADDDDAVILKLGLVRVRIPLEDWAMLFWASLVDVPPDGTCDR